MSFVVERFEDFAKKKPEQTAVQKGASLQTYRELQTYSYRVTSYILNHLKLKHGDWIGVHVDTDTFLIPLILGVWQAGCVYVPLDTFSPESRIQLILKDANLAYVFNESKMMDVMRYQQMGSFHRKQLTETDIAYVVYTSGTTGKPKGVVVCHDSLNNLLEYFSKLLKFSDEDILLSCTSIGFDISNLELFLPICCGGKIVFTTRETRLDPEKLLAELQTSQATVMQATPEIWKLLVSYDFADTHLRHALCGGEAWNISLAQQFFLKCPKNCTLWNVYGPTETTIWSFVNRISPKDDRIDMGSPIQNTYFYIVDEHGKQCLKGELLIGGIGVAKGYHEREKLSKERFIKDPFSSDPDQRVYKTGDIVESNESRLRFLGRNDSQVKIRGYRVELQEIEAHLVAHSAVTNAVVFYEDFDHLREKTLVACVEVSEHQKDPLQKQLPLDISHVLPLYMLPQKWVWMTAFPMNANGKIDRCFLKEQASKHCRIETHDEVSTLPTQLATIWKNLLKVNHIEKDSHFMNLGGHSLLMVRMVSQIRKSLKIPVNLQDVAAHPTFDALLKFLREKSASFLNSHHSITPKTSSKSYQLTDEQLDNWEIDYLHGGTETVQSVSYWKIDGLLDFQRLEKAVNTVVERHDGLRLCFQKTPQGIFQSVAMHQPFILQLRSTGISETLREVLASPFSIEQSPQVKFFVEKTNDREYFLLSHNHHIALDGWSKSLMLQEIGNVYQSPQEANLPPSISFLEYLDWIQQWMLSSEYRPHLSFWEHFIQKDYLQRTPSISSLSHSAKPFSGGIEYFTVSQHTSQILKTLSQKLCCTPACFMLSMYSWCLASLFNQDYLLLTLPVAGRFQRRFEKVIGLLANTVFLPIHVQADESFSQFTGRVHHIMHQALTYATIPYRKVQEIFGWHQIPYAERPGGMMFLFHNEPEKILNLGEGINTKKMHVHSTSCVVDLLFEVYQKDNGFEFSVEYAKQFIDRIQVLKLIESYESLLSQLTENQELKFNQELQYAN